MSRNQAPSRQHSYHGESIEQLRSLLQKSEKALGDEKDFNNLIFKQIGEKDNKIKQLEHQLNLMEMELNLAQESLAEARTSSKAERRGVHDADMRATLQIEQLQAELHHKGKELASTKDSLQACQIKLRNYEGTLDATQAAFVRKREELKTKTECLMAREGELKSIRATLEKNEFDLRATREESARKEGRVQDLLVKLELAKQRGQQLEETLTGRVEKDRHNDLQLHGELRRLSETESDLRAKLQETTRRCQMLEDGLARKEQEKGIVEGQLQDVHRRFSHADRELTQLFPELTQLKARLGESTKRCDQFQEALQRKEQVMQREIQQREREEEENASLRRQLAEVERELQEINLRYQVLEEELARKGMEIKDEGRCQGELQAQQEYDRLRQHYSDLTDRLLYEMRVTSALTEELEHTTKQLHSHSRPIFMDKVQQYREYTSSLAKRFRQSPFAEWSPLESDLFLSEDVDDKCRVVVHLGCLYLATHSITNKCMLWRTSDKKHWERIERPPSTAKCRGLISHGKCLYFLSFPKKGYSVKRELVFYKMTFVYEKRKSTIKWCPLPGGACPFVQWNPAAFAVGDSLLLAGGWNGEHSLPIVTEYDLKQEKWLMGDQTRWPTLPQATDGLESVRVGEFVHLVGGMRTSAHHSTASKAVYSMQIRDGNPFGGWRTDIYHNTAYGSSGACCLYDHVLVAGGTDTSTPAAKRQNAVFLLGAGEGEGQVELPSLATARARPALVFFQGSLLAIGGSVPGEREVQVWINTIEELQVDSVCARV